MFNNLLTEVLGFISTEYFINLVSFRLLFKHGDTAARMPAQNRNSRWAE